MHASSGSPPDVEHLSSLIIPESRLPPYLFLRGCNNLWQIVLIVTMLAAKLQPRRLQPEDLRAYNAVLVVLPSVCLLLVAVARMWSLLNARTIQRINSSSFNAFRSSCLLLSVCNLARWLARSKRDRAALHSVAREFLT